MKQISWTDEQSQFDERAAMHATGPLETVSNLDGTVFLATSTFDAAEREFEDAPYLMIAHTLGGTGRFLRSGDWGKVEGILRPRTSMLALPNTKAKGYFPKVRLLGIAIDPSHVQDALADVGGLDALAPAATKLHFDPLIDAVMIAIWRDAQAHGLSSAFFDHGINLILKRFSNVDKPTRSPKATKPLSSRELRRVQDLIESKIDTDLRVKEIASELDWDLRSFTRAFRATTGYAPYEYLTYRRMERAKVLLEAGVAIMSISLEVGYANPAKFAAAFRRFNGCTPSQWRNGVRKISIS